MMVLPRLQQARRTRLRVDCNDAKREDREHGETLHRKEQQETCITIYSIEIKNVVPVRVCVHTTPYLVEFLLSTIVPPYLFYSKMVEWCS